MESFLKAVGFSSQSAGSPLKTSASFSYKSPKSSRRKSTPAACLPTKKGQDEADLLVPDLAHVAAATEQGILALEEEARSLDKASVNEAVDRLRTWSQALRKRLRHDESLASFKVQFLRSNALEKALEALRKNTPLRNEMSDKPLFASEGSSPAEAVMAELRGVLQLCLPRAAAQLVEPTVQLVFADALDENFMAALTALRSLKEDWREVVRAQAVRSHERRLDSLAYELQKIPGSPSLSSSRKASHDHVAVLASLVEVLGQWQAGAETHSAEIDNALLSLGLKTPSTSSSLAPAGSHVDDPSRRRASSEYSGASSQQVTEADSAPCSEDLLPSYQDCEEAVNAMVTKTEAGMREGLMLLGLPTTPLHWVPGQELRLCGHDVRVAVNTMIGHWMADEKNAFFEVLNRVRQILDKPCGVQDDLLSLRARLVLERQALSQKLAEVDQRLSEVDAQLSGLPGHSPRRSVQGDEQSRDEVASEGLMSSLPPNSSTSTVEATCSISREKTSSSLSGDVGSMAEALSLENQRSLERLATTLQQRRTELLAALTTHLRGEEERLAALSVAPSGVLGAELVAAEQLQVALEEARHLCEHVEAAIDGPERAKSAISGLSTGTRCRARWMDGNFYDASIHSVGLDGTVVVNWLRPRASSDDSPDRPLRTISESGGDDSLHRVVAKADIHIEGRSPRGQSEPQAAHRAFQSRGPEDRTCVDCNSAVTEWASISFGTYLCETCAAEHRQLGAKLSLVRQLNDGWGWTQRDLKYLTAGGNAAFRAQLEKYPEVQEMRIYLRYATRFAEHYRRHLDAICTGAQLPPPVQPETAEQPSQAGDFLSRAEAAAVAREVSNQFEEAAQIATTAMTRTASDTWDTQQRAFRSVSDASGMPRKHRATKVSC